ncbi:hypothetical protein OH807_05880 [Kitasatospora sp. NBC_01560]|uniref:hypothetical protein n=1 Tax=Kitasatospora sp. NBC_01560 TaxID=2975965 RepID=UPI00386E5093
MTGRPLSAARAQRLSTVAALALAARLFPNRAEEPFRHASAIRDAHFLVSGHTHLWDRFPDLSPEDTRRVTRLLLHRPGRLAIYAAFRRAAQELFDSPELPEGFAPLDDELYLVTGPLQQRLASLVDEALETLDDRRAAADEGRSRDLALHGHFRMGTQIPDPSRPGNGVIQAHYVLDLPEIQTPLPDFGKPKECLTLRVPIDELRAIADAVDGKFGQSHRRKSLDRLFKHIRRADGSLLTDGFLTLDAGLIRVLSACTGSGKSVLAKLLAEWGVKNNLVTGIVVPRNDAVFSFTRALREELAVLGLPNAVVPLISPNSMQDEAEKTARSLTEEGRTEEADEAYGEFSYGCAMQAKSTNKQDVDLWQPGQERCADFEGTDPESGEMRRYRCAWFAHCGKHRHQMALDTANVIVTSHINLMSGRLHVPVLAGGQVRNYMTVEEALLRLTHLLLIDEADAFQATGFAKSAHHVTLARYGSRQPSALQELHDQFSVRAGALMYELERYIHPKITQARFLSESYVSNAANGRIAQRGPNERNRQQLARRRLIIPRRWDAWCTARLWRTADGTSPTREQIDAFRKLFNPKEEAQLEDATVPAIPGIGDSSSKHLAVLRAELLDATALREGTDPVYNNVHAKIAAVVQPLLAPALTEDDRELLVDLLVRRAYLEQIRAQIEYVTRLGTSLKASGINAANELTEMLEDNKQWHAAPYGPLGAPVFGFTAIHDVEDKHRTELALTSFTGDPHAYTAQLGDTTALALCSQRRIVIGLSATAHMPGGTMHHLITPPTWYVPDDITGSLVLRPLRLVDDRNNPIRISGTSDIHRDQAHQQMGRALWTQIIQRLKKLASRPATAHRARILVACTSYLGAAQLAEGMISAGADPESIAVATRASDESTVPAHYRRRPAWYAIPSDALERFPHHPTAKVLIAPLAIAERGLNMVDNSGRSLVGEVILAVRPIPLMDEPAQLLALISSRAYSSVNRSEDPAGMLRELSTASSAVHEELFRSHHFFQSLPSKVRLSIVAEMLIGIIQLGGRVRRGGDQGVLYLADHAFHNTTSGSDLPRLIRELRDGWARAGQLELLQNIYGSTLRAIFDFADERTSN